MLQRTLKATYNSILIHSKSCARRYSADIQPRKGDRVIIAMSGGVDSSVTARLLVDKDYDLSAIFMRNWDTRDESGTDIGCEWEKDWEDVQKVCRMLGLPCEMVDFSREYWTRVFEPSLEMWAQGLTPNPDVWCNREIKFGALLDHLIITKDVNWIATGHYAGVQWEKRNAGPRPKLVRASDKTKDQTYYLSGIREASLKRAIFPLHRLKKSDIRDLARKYDLPTAERKESMGICFVGEKRNFEDFLAQYIPPTPGAIINMENRRRIGTHGGLWRYTIGQKARVPGLSEKMYVAKKIMVSNDLLVVPGGSHHALMSTGAVVENFKWIWHDDIPSAVKSDKGFRAEVQIRYRTPTVCCVMRSNFAGQLAIDFAEPQYAVTPGQVAAIYDGAWCLGSGIISHVNDGITEVS